MVDNVTAAHVEHDQAAFGETAPLAAPHESFDHSPAAGAGAGAGHLDAQTFVHCQPLLRNSAAPPASTAGRPAGGDISARNHHTAIHHYHS